MSIRSFVNPRRLDQRIRFERNTPTQDGNGDPVDNWAVVGKSWAAVDGALARDPEPYVAGAIVSKQDYTVWIRSDVMQRYGLRVRDRVHWNDTYFDIKDMPNQQLRGRLIAFTMSAGENVG